MRNPTVRSPSSSSSASTSSIRASESASRSSTNDAPSVIVDGIGLQNVGQLVPDQLEHPVAVEGSLVRCGFRQAPATPVYVVGRRSITAGVYSSTLNWAYHAVLARSRDRRRHLVGQTPGRRTRAPPGRR